MTLKDIPDEIHIAAEKLDTFFKKQNQQHWQLGGTCSRNFAYEHDVMRQSFALANERVRKLEAIIRKLTVMKEEALQSQPLLFKTDPIFPIPDKPWCEECGTNINFVLDPKNEWVCHGTHRREGK